MWLTVALLAGRTAPRQSCSPRVGVEKCVEADGWQMVRSNWDTLQWFLQWLHLLQFVVIFATKQPSLHHTAISTIFFIKTIITLRNIPPAYAHTHMNTYTHTCMHTHEHMQTHIHTYTHTHARTRTHGKAYKHTPYCCCSFRHYVIIALWLYDMYRFLTSFSLYSFMCYSLYYAQWYIDIYDKCQKWDINPLITVTEHVETSPGGVKLKVLQSVLTLLVVVFCSLGEHLGHFLSSLTVADPS